MSQDLFAAFGEAAAPSGRTQPAIGNRHDIWGFSSPAAEQQVPAAEDPSHHPSQPARPSAFPTDDDEDDFGDFEDAAVHKDEPVSSGKAVNAGFQKSAPPASHPKVKTSAPCPPRTNTKETQPPATTSKVGRHPFADHMDFLFSGGDDEYDAGNDDLEDLSKNPEAAMEYSKRMIAEQQAQVSKKKPLPFSKPSIAQAPATAATPEIFSKKSEPAPAKDPNVLFDADNISEHDGDDDDFGDFETVAEPSLLPKNTSVTKLHSKSGTPNHVRQSGTKPSMPAIDLLGLNDDTTTFGNSTNGVMSPRSERVTSILGGAKSDSHSRPPASGSLLSQAPMQQEDDAWNDFDAAEPINPPSLTSDYHSASGNTSRAQFTATTTPNVAKNELPPTNVPPPVILLSAFAPLLSSAEENLFSQMSKLDSASRHQLLTHPATHQFLHKYLRDGTALAHIIAGRKLRWKRDQILAQSMRIGPSAAGGRGGMKLTSIDKSEVGKEDREVLDTVQRWKAQSGKLRGAVTTASTNQSGSIRLPNVPEIAEVMPIKTLKPTEGGFTAPHACALCGLKREERVAKVDVDVNDSFGEWWVDGMSMHLVCKDWWDQNKAKLKSR